MAKNALLNFYISAAFPADPWNNILMADADDTAWAIRNNAGTVLASLQDEDNNPTGWTLYNVDINGDATPWEFGRPADTGTFQLAWIDEGNVSIDGIRLDVDTQYWIFEIRGLDNSKWYDFEFYASRAATDRRFTDITINGVVQSTPSDLGNNVRNTKYSALFESIKPVDGAVQIRVDPGASGTASIRAYMQAMRVTERDAQRKGEEPKYLRPIDAFRIRGFDVQPDPTNSDEVTIWGYRQTFRLAKYAETAKTRIDDTVNMGAHWNVKFPGDVTTDTEVIIRWLFKRGDYLYVVIYPDSGAGSAFEGRQALFRFDLDFTNPTFIDFISTQNDGIEGITKGATTTITQTAHNKSNGDVVVFYDVGGMTQINGLAGTVSGATANTYVLDIDSSTFDDYTSGGNAATWIQFDWILQAGLDRGVINGTDRIIWGEYVNSNGAGTKECKLKWCIYGSEGTTVETLANFNNPQAQGEINHFHTVKVLDDGSVVIGQGDTVGNQSAIIKWNGVSDWPADANLTIANLAVSPGFNVLFGSQLYRAIQFAFRDDKMYWTVDNSNNISIQRCNTADLSGYEEVAARELFQGTDEGWYTWNLGGTIIGMGTPQELSGNFYVFVASDSGEPNTFRRTHNVYRSNTVDGVRNTPQGGIQLGNRVYFSGNDFAKGWSSERTYSYELSSERWDRGLGENTTGLPGTTSAGPLFFVSDEKGIDDLNEGDGDDSEQRGTSSRFPWASLDFALIHCAPLSAIVMDRDKVTIADALTTDFDDGGTGWQNAPTPNPTETGDAALLPPPDDVIRIGGGTVTISEGFSLNDTPDGGAGGDSGDKFEMLGLGDTVDGAIKRKLEGATPEGLGLADTTDATIIP